MTKRSAGFPQEREPPCVAAKEPQHVAELPVGEHDVWQLIIISLRRRQAARAESLVFDKQRSRELMLSRACFRTKLRRDETKYILLHSASQLASQSVNQRDKQTDQTSRHTDRQTDRPTDAQTTRQTGAIHAHFILESRTRTNTASFNRAHPNKGARGEAEQERNRK